MSNSRLVEVLKGGIRKLSLVGVLAGLVALTACSNEMPTGPESNGTTMEQPVPDRTIHTVLDDARQRVTPNLPASVERDQLAAALTVVDNKLAQGVATVGETLAAVTAARVAVSKCADRFANDPDTAADLDAIDLQLLVIRDALLVGSAS